MERDLWLLGGPVRKVRRGSLPGALWGSKFPFSHWALLSTELSVQEIEYLTSLEMTEAIQQGEVIKIGMIYELTRGERDVISVSTTPSVSSTFRLQWPNFIKQYIGRTTMTEVQIIEIGK